MDVQRAELLGQLRGQVLHGALGGAVPGHGGQADVATQGADVDDVSATAFPASAGGRPGPPGLYLPPHVGLELIPHLIGAGLFDNAEPPLAGSVDDHIYSTEALDALLDCPLDAGSVGDVETRERDVVEIGQLRDGLDGVTHSGHDVPTGCVVVEGERFTMPVEAPAMRTVLLMMSSSLMWCARSALTAGRTPPRLAAVA
nr:hypothetical protein [Streptomyces longhuiensis]